MASFNINLKSKKSQLFAEAIVWFIFILFLTITIFFSSNSVKAEAKEFETLIPEISHEFPKVFLHNFLHMELNSSDKKIFFDDENSNYYVKDLLWLDTEDSFNRYLDYEKEYISKVQELTENNDKDKDFLENYETFSGQKNSYSDLIITVKDLPKGTKLNLIELFEEHKNYYFYFKTKEGKDYYIFFNSRGTP